MKAQDLELFFQDIADSPGEPPRDGQGFISTLMQELPQRHDRRYRAAERRPRRPYVDLHLHSRAQGVPTSRWRTSRIPASSLPRWLPRSRSARVFDRSLYGAASQGKLRTCPPPPCKLDDGPAMQGARRMRYRYTAATASCIRNIGGAGLGRYLGAADLRRYQRDRQKEIIARAWEARLVSGRGG